MADFQFLENPLSKKWVILAPRRARRPDVAKGSEPVCPFCVGREKDEKELFRIPSNNDPTSSDWLVRVIPNKFPFAPVHEIVIHSPDHHKNFDELPSDHVELILQAYRHRYNEHQWKGQVYIFHNRGIAGGESLPHPHSQLAVVPDDVTMDIPRLDPTASVSLAPKPRDLNGQGDSGQEPVTTVETEHFYLFCPQTSQWPDEVWIAPKLRGRAFGEITDEQIKDFAKTLSRIIQIFNLRHGHDFPFNFYIYPGGDWYLRLMPRTKTLGGFEMGTGIFVNTQDPAETIAFIKAHFDKPDLEKLEVQNLASYEKVV